MTRLLLLILLFLLERLCRGFGRCGWWLRGRRRRGCELGAGRIAHVDLDLRMGRVRERGEDGGDEEGDEREGMEARA